MTECADQHEAMNSTGITTLLAWDADGAHRHDAVRLRYLASLARRAASLEEPARSIVESRVAQAFGHYQRAFEQARRQAAQTVAQVAAGFPASADAIQQLFNCGDFGAVQRFAARLQRHFPDRCGLASLVDDVARAGARQDEEASDEQSLDDLLHRQEQAAYPAGIASAVAAGQDGVRDLKAIRQFRDAWARRVVDKAIAQAVEDAPENAGPLNAHGLVIRAIMTMREISPAYLNRFVSSIDTLLWLEQLAGQFPAAEPKRPEGKVSGKRNAKARRQR